MRILKDLDVDVEGRDVVLVEDLVDTGLTLAYLLRHLAERGAALARRVHAARPARAADRPARRSATSAQEIDDVFVLGYGLHHADLYRNLPFVVEADRNVVLERPGAYVDALYGAGRRPSDLRRPTPREGRW